MGGSWIVNLILLGQCGLKEDQLPSSLAAKSRSRKRKTVDGYVEDMEDKYNAKKSRTLKSCKLLLRRKKNCHENKQRLIFFLLTKIVVLIHTHMEIKPTVTVMHGSIFRILYIPM